MPSLIPGYEYDIFISYRQKDNKGERWVTDFVNALKTELDATIKEELTIYFDQNPHDGLLETHQVDKSLEGKLKCPIFIPIISQTYCDPIGFAWQHEFLAFNSAAQKDEFGRDIKLRSGNVTSRILPVRIHDLDPEDLTLLENELGGKVRAIDFIFNSSGVNRPLTPLDKREDNTNKTFYRDQVNKVAHAIKDLIVAMRTPTEASQINTATKGSKTAYRPSKTKWMIAGAVAVALSIATYFGLPLVSSRADQTSGLDKSIAVLPFVDMSPVHNQEYFADGLSEELLNLLAQVPELKVIGRTSSFQFKGKNEDLREIGKKLNVGRVLEGSVRKSENNLKITAQLINTTDGSHVWSQTFNRKFDEVFAIQDEIAAAVVEALKVNMLGNFVPKRTIPVNAEAYNSFVQGRFFYEVNSDSATTLKAVFYFKESIRLDSTFALPWTYLSMCYWRAVNIGGAPLFKAAKRAAERALELDPTLSIAVVNMAEILDNEYDLTGAEEKIKLALQLDPNNPYVLRNAGRYYTLLGKQEESISYCLRALQNDPIQGSALYYLTYAYFYAGRYKEAAVTRKKGQTYWSLGFRDVSIQTMLERGEVEAALKEATLLKDVVLMAAANFRSGNRREAMALCDQLINNHAANYAYYIAFAYAYGDEKEKVLDWLERAYSNHERQLTYLKVDPAFKKFRNEDRFKKLLQKMRFPA